MSVVAIIPVKGRFSLLVWTLDRLMEVNRVDRIVMVGHEEEGQELARLMGADWVYHPNFPLGSKYNEGWEYAFRKYDPDHYVFMGASDWMNREWLPVMTELAETYEMVGRNDKYYYSLHPSWNRLLHFTGSEVGSCAVIPRRVVRQYEGRPFNDTMETDLDWSLRANIKDIGGIVHSSEDKESKILSVSCYKWTNAYNFEGYWNNTAKTTRLGHGTDWLKENFKDALEMTLW